MLFGIQRIMTKNLFRFDFSRRHHNYRSDIVFDKVFIVELTVEKALEIFRREYPSAAILQIAQDPFPVIV